MNADRLECAHVGGWHCVVGKGDFLAGDYAVYFEIDSKLPEIEPFTSMEFLKSKHYIIKSQRIRGEISQGLLVPLSAFVDINGSIPTWLAEINLNIATGKDVTNTFLTKELGVTYAVAADNVRKAQSSDRYRSMQDRHKKIFKSKFGKWIMKYSWGRKIMFFFFGKKKDKKNEWPAWVVKTDEERCQNEPWLFEGDYKNKVWVATEKIDGTSTTFTMKGFGKKRQFLVCSRNVAFTKPDKKCFYDTNVYLEMAEKYDIEKILADTLDKIYREINGNIDFITIQAETYGCGIQKRDYGMTDHDMAVFNVIYGYKDGTTIRLNPIQGKEAAERAGLKYVPIVDEHFQLPNTCEELLEMASGTSCIDGGMREGLVFRSLDGVESFKAVSNEFLLKYHN